MLSTKTCLPQPSQQLPQTPDPTPPCQDPRVCPHWTPMQHEAPGRRGLWGHTVFRQKPGRSSQLWGTALQVQSTRELQGTYRAPAGLSPLSGLLSLEKACPWQEWRLQHVDSCQVTRAGNRLAWTWTRGRTQHLFYPGSPFIEGSSAVAPSCLNRDRDADCNALAILMAQSPQTLG